MKFIINLALVDFDKTGNFASAENMIRNTKFKVQVQQAVAKEFFTDKLTNVVNHLNGLLLILMTIQLTWKKAVGCPPLTNAKEIK